MPSTVSTPYFPSFGVSQPIRYFHRYSGRMETESIYGEPWLRWTYETAPGNLLLHLVIRHPWFSRFYGWRMNRPASRRRIEPFVRRFGIDASEFAEPVSAFSHFNAFFARKLRPEARSIDPSPNHAVFPADGRHLGFPNLTDTPSVFVKGQRFELPGLLGDPELARRYASGSLVLSRLAPPDYHRFHYPVPGFSEMPVPVDGFLYSVNPIALRRRLAFLWQNRRMVTRLQGGAFGELLLVEVGATCVGSIVQSAPGNAGVLKGAEKGWFRFGGSAVLTLFEPGSVDLAPDLVEATQTGNELYAHMGDVMATRRK